MKQLAHSALLAALLAALLSGCADTPSKDASIEDRGIRTEAAVPVRAEAAKIVEATPVETNAVAGAVPVSEAANKSGEGVRTATATTQPISTQAVGTVETRGVVVAGSEVKPLGTGQPAAEAKGAAAAQDGATLPKPDAAPTWGDLKNPEHLLSRRRLLFDYDSAAIRDEYRPVLEAHVRFLKANQEARAILQGHADERGSREYNLALGQRRAESVFKAMTLLGVPEAQMEAVSLGEEKAVVDGHDEAAWQQNRRTELLYQGE